MGYRDRSSFVLFLFLPMLLAWSAPWPARAAMQEEPPPPYEADLRAAREAIGRSEWEKAEQLSASWLDKAAKEADLDLFLVMALDRVAEEYRDARRFAEAERLYQQLQTLAEAKHGAESATAALQVKGLADAYVAQEKLAAAEPLFRRLLAGQEKAYGDPNHPRLAEHLHALAETLRRQAKCAEAEPLYRRTLKLVEDLGREMGVEHPGITVPLDGLADCLKQLGKASEAQAAAKRSEQARQRWEQEKNQMQEPGAATAGEPAAGAEVMEPPPQSAPESALAAPIRDVEKALDAADFAGAEKLLAPLLARVGTEGPPIETLALLPLADKFEALGRVEPAERIYLRTLEVLEQAGGPASPFLVPAVEKLARLYQAQKRWTDAETYFKRSLAIHEAAYREEGMPEENPRVFSAVENLAELYMAAGRYADAEVMFKRVLASMEKVAGPDAPLGDLVLTRLGDAARLQQHYADAEAFYQRAVKASGKDNPFRDAPLVGLAEVYSAQGKYKEAEPLFQEAIAAQEEVLGPENPDLIGTLEKYAALLRATNRAGEAARLEARAQKIKAATEAAPR